MYYWCTCLEYYGSEWGAMLKMTGVTFEKINDPDEYMFFDQGKRGRVSYINKRYSKANNEYCKDYDKEKPKKYIIHLDMNNLYGQWVNIYHMLILNESKTDKIEQK